jgi:hypothetical protein
MRGMLLIAGLTILMTIWRSPFLVVPRWWQLGVLAALLQVPAYVWNAADWLLPISYVLLCAVAWRNQAQAGGRLILAGMLLNALPILIVGHMPLWTCSVHS